MLMIAYTKSDQGTDGTIKKFLTANQKLYKVIIYEQIWFLRKFIPDIATKWWTVEKTNRRLFVK